ncbi:MAG: helix-turn-helix domain-containing protein [Myxococcota bacterium]|nr:helix-turn-helix domain-containing protein [Myxococcota bacterium]
MRIGTRVRELREQRSWSQAELAKRLRLSQPRLSNIERGLASLTAEQFLEVLTTFNETTAAFTGRAVESAELELQNALGRLGATHLHVTERVVPSERLADPHEAIFATLKQGGSRLLTSLAPVLVEQAETLNLTRLAVDLDSVGLRRRLYWVLENTFEAIGLDTKQVGARSSTRYRRASRMIEMALEFGRGYEQHLSPTLPDVLDSNIRTKQTAEQVRSAGSAISRRWLIVSRLHPADFLRALQEARAGD